LDYIALVLPLAEMTLEEYRNNTELSLRDVKILALQITRGMAYIQSRDILHGDYKPVNILVYLEQDCPPRLVIADFGLARTDKCFKRYEDPYGIFSPYWRAPELMMGADYEAATDVWVLGLMIAYLLVGEIPFSSRSDTEQLTKIFLSLGVPTEATWPGVTDYPRYNLEEWQEITATLDPELELQLVPQPSPEYTDSKIENRFLASLLSLTPSKRPILTQILLMSWFDEVRDVLDHPCLKAPPIESLDCTKTLLRHQAALPILLPTHVRYQAITYGWVEEMREELLYTERTKALSFYLFERYLFHKQISRNVLQLYMMACFYIAATMVEDKYFPVVHYIQYGAGAFEADELAFAIREVLNRVGVDLYVATSYDILYELSMEYREETKQVANTILQLSYYTAISIEEVPAILSLICLLEACLYTSEPFRHKTLVEELGRQRVDNIHTIFGKSLAITMQATYSLSIVPSLERGYGSIKSIIRKTQLALYVPKELVEEKASSISEETLEDKFTNFNV
jgi:hypothetical protein